MACRTGILTFQNANNYGAVLQAFALQTTLKDLGHEVSIIPLIWNLSPARVMISMSS